MDKKIQRLVIILLLIPFFTSAQVWDPNIDEDTYKNPIIHADYSDPDVAGHNGDYYMVASSFNVAPGLPVLHSKDLVNWEIVGHVFDKQIPVQNFKKPQHGNGAWAPSITYHDGEFYVYYGDPDYGIYMSKTKNPEGEWSKPHLVHEGKGWIDPSPLWDDDGNAYLVHAYAGSRSSRKSILVMREMNEAGTEVSDEEVIVFDGHGDQPTIEGPKLYKRNGYYYIFAPAGGVTPGWQTVLRSKNIYGPYEAKKVLAQGNTEINGPHQGGWVSLPSGEDWFIHFQDKAPYGRIVHMQPVKWEKNWPVMGKDKNGDGTGEPVLTHKKPDVGGNYPKKVPQTSDEFNDNFLGPQWQWHANPEITWGAALGGKGKYRLYTIYQPDSIKNFWQMGNLLMQKLPAEEFTTTTKVTFNAHTEDETAGLVIMGQDYATLTISKENDEYVVYQTVCKDAYDLNPAEIKNKNALENNTVYLRVKVEAGGVCQFSYSNDGENYQEVGDAFQAREGKWIGAKVGLFANRRQEVRDAGYADFDWFRFK